MSLIHYIQEDKRNSAVLCVFIQNGIKQGEALPPLTFNFLLKCGIGKVQENHGGLKCNRTHQFLACFHDVNLLRGDRNTVKIKTEALKHTSWKVGLEVNIDNTKYMLLSRLLNAGITITQRQLIQPLK
jgi:hypothetical protein